MLDSLDILKMFTNDVGYMLGGTYAHSHVDHQTTAVHAVFSWII